MQRVVDLIRLLVRATDKPPRLEMNNLTTITMMATLPLKAVQPPSYHGISNSAHVSRRQVFSDRYTEPRRQSIV